MKKAATPNRNPACAPGEFHPLMEIPEAAVEHRAPLEHLPREIRASANSFGSPISLARRSASSASGVVSTSWPYPEDRI